MAEINTLIINPTTNVDDLLLLMQDMSRFDPVNDLMSYLDADAVAIFKPWNYRPEQWRTLLQLLTRLPETTKVKYVFQPDGDTDKAKAFIPNVAATGTASDQCLKKASVFEWQVKANHPTLDWTIARLPCFGESTLREIHFRIAAEADGRISMDTNIKAYFVMLGRMQCLEKLCLEYQGFIRSLPRWALGALFRSKSLSELTMSNVDLDDEDTDAIAGALLKKNPPLETFGMICACNSKGILKMMNALAANDTVRRFHVHATCWFKNVNDSVALQQAQEQLFRDNHTIEDFRLVMNKYIGGSYHRELSMEPQCVEALLRANTTVKTLGMPRVFENPHILANGLETNSTLEDIHIGLKVDQAGMTVLNNVFNGHSHSGLKRLHLELLLADVVDHQGLFPFGCYTVDRFEEGLRNTEYDIDANANRLLLELAAALNQEACKIAHLTISWRGLLSSEEVCTLSPRIEAPALKALRDLMRPAWEKGPETTPLKLLNLTTGWSDLNVDENILQSDFQGTTVALQQHIDMYHRLHKSDIPAESYFSSTPAFLSTVNDIRDNFDLLFYLCQHFPTDLVSAVNPNPHARLLEKSDNKLSQQKVEHDKEIDALSKQLACVTCGKAFLVFFVIGCWARATLNQLDDFTCDWSNWPSWRLPKIVPELAFLVVSCIASTFMYKKMGPIITILGIAPNLWDATAIKELLVGWFAYLVLWSVFSWKFYFDGIPTSLEFCFASFFFGPLIFLCSSSTSTGLSPLVF